MLVLPVNPQNLTDKDLNLDNLKEIVTIFKKWQEQEFLNKKEVADLVYIRANFMDMLLTRLWKYFQLNKIEHLSLIAVGGYGRAELHPLSDIDILVLSPDTILDETAKKIGEFITYLWDLSFDVGHSVRTLEQCISHGKDDLTIATNLLEARFITGNATIYNSLKDAVRQNDFWPSSKFYAAKLSEQKTRHKRFNNTTYNLEPDIKASVGGLRDIHTLHWVALRHYGAKDLFAMSQLGFLTENEYRELAAAQNFLWKVRFALHIELKRYDNRLTFANQANVAKNLNYIGDNNQSVEKLMKDFYRTLQNVAELNNMLLQFFAQEIYTKKDDAKIVILNKNFQRRGDLLEVRQANLFLEDPTSILDMCLYLAQDKNISAISSLTLRQLRTTREQINGYLYETKRAREKFILLISHPNFISKVVDIMHRQGILSLYMPQWQYIVGQMQFDLFHAYTVDEHSIRLLKIINTFAMKKAAKELPLCHAIYPQIKRLDLLILAAIFHDIGKGRGGDHSTIGAEISYEFSILHELSQADADLVKWLVENHLVMSHTTQKKDIYDPDVIYEFAQLVKTKERLGLLCCLTIADISATNDGLWNGWKRTLMAELYNATLALLEQGMQADILEKKLEKHQQLAANILENDGVDKLLFKKQWERFKDDYFIRHTPEQIAWHTSNIIINNKEPLILISENATRGGTEIFIYTPDVPQLFSQVVALIDRKKLSIHDAQIMGSKDGYTLDTFIVLEPNGEPLNSYRRASLTKAITTMLNKPFKKIKVNRAPKKLKHFKVKTEVKFTQSLNKQRSQMELIALDNPGLLARVGEVFAFYKINLHAARITTIGERAEDFFILTNKDGEPLSTLEQQDLQNRIKEILD